MSNIRNDEITGKLAVIVWVIKEAFKLVVSSLLQMKPWDDIDKS